MMSGLKRGGRDGGGSRHMIEREKERRFGYVRGGEEGRVGVWSRKRWRVGRKMG